MILSLGGWSVLVFLDWTYWKAAPYSVHSEIAHGIVFTLLFLRFCNGLDFRRVMRELKNPHRLIVSLLGALNGIISTITLLRCRSNYPDFLRLPYFLLLLIVIIIGYF